MTLSESPQRINTGIITACLVGLALSYYAYVVEDAKERDASYVAMCDISEHVSCTRAFSSKFGKGFGILSTHCPFYVRNSLFGLVFYSLFAAISVSQYKYGPAVLVAMGILANVASVYLAGILVVLRNICIVCVGTYIVNAIILILAVRKYRITFPDDSRKQKIK